ncbi:MAG: hypothetical protein ABJG47_04290 [Ekhidna sp.]
MKPLKYCLLIPLILSFSCKSGMAIRGSQTSANATQPDVSQESTSTDVWSEQPNSSSSKIKVLDAANAFSSLPNGLTQMGYEIVQNTDSYLETNFGQDDIKVKIFVVGSDIVLTSEEQQYTIRIWHSTTCWFERV